MSFFKKKLFIHQLTLFNYGSKLSHCKSSQQSHPPSLTLAHICDCVLLTISSSSFSSLLLLSLERRCRLLVSMVCRSNRKRASTAPDSGAHDGSLQCSGDDTTITEASGVPSRVKALAIIITSSSAAITAHIHSSYSQSLISRLTKEEQHPKSSIV